MYKAAFPDMRMDVEDLIVGGGKVCRPCHSQWHQ